MRFLADESCDFAVVRALRNAGHDVKAVVELSPGISDDEVAMLALKELRILLTEDKDFGQMIHTKSQASVGVVFIRFPSLLRLSMAEMIVRLVKEYGEKLHNRFVVVTPSRVRITGIPFLAHHQKRIE